jgi:dTDP-4-dehydrorhamnose 3,5-epimerase
VKVTQLSLPGAYVIDLTPIEDSRGYFVTTYNEQVFLDNGLQTRWVQENESMSTQNVLRGLHFQQPPHAQTKLVRVVSGAVLDVIVDLRKSSPTFGKWEAVELSEHNHRMLYVPKGLAHGFCAIEDQSVMVYKVDQPYEPSADGGILWNDPDLRIDWPVENPIVSAKDQNLPRLKDFNLPEDWDVTA